MTEIVRITERTAANIQLMRFIQSHARSRTPFSYNGQKWLITSIQMSEDNETVVVEGDLLK